NKPVLVRLLPSDGGIEGALYLVQGSREVLRVGRRADLLVGDRPIECEAGDRFRLRTPVHFVGERIPIPGPKASSIYRKPKTSFAFGQRSLGGLPLRYVYVDAAVA